MVKHAAEANPEMFTTNKSYWAKDEITSYVINGNEQDVKRMIDYVI